MRQLFLGIGEKGSLHYELYICSRSLSVDIFLAVTQEYPPAVALKKRHRTHGLGLLI